MSACVRATLHSVRLCGEDTCDTRGHAVSATYPQGNSQIPAGTTNYIYYSNQWQVIEVRTGGPSVSDVSTQIVWSAAYVNAAILQDAYSNGAIQPNERLYFLQDADWNTTAVVGYNPTTQTWGVVQRFVYDSYGNITILNADWSATAAGTAPVVNALYQGMQYDPVTGLYYGRARWYSPSLGRWISQDPFFQAAGAIGPAIASSFQVAAGSDIWAGLPPGRAPRLPPSEAALVSSLPRLLAGQGQNLYEYASDDPVGLVDPGGMLHLCHDTCDAAFMACIAGFWEAGPAEWAACFALFELCLAHCHHPPPPPPPPPPNQCPPPAGGHAGPPAPAPPPGPCPTCASLDAGGAAGP